MRTLAKARRRELKKRNLGRVDDGVVFLTSQLRGFAVSRGTWNDKLHVDAIPMKLSQNRFDLSELVHALDRLPILGLKRWSDEAFKAVWRFASRRSPWGAVAE
jgi:hypothetical protein